MRRDRYRVPEISKQCCLIALFSIIAISAAAQIITNEKAAQLAQQFLPEVVRNDYAESDSLDQIQNPLEKFESAETDAGVRIRYVSFKMPGDTSQYVLLAWKDHKGGLLDEHSHRRHDEERQAPVSRCTGLYQEDRKN